MAVQKNSENQNSLKSFSFKQKLVFGTWRLADKDSAEPKDILERIKKCIELGMINFDLADIYGGYTYEELFGNALALEPTLRSKIQLISKCNIQYPVGENRPDVKVHYYDTSKEHIIWSVNRSLQKLKIEYLDVLLLHRPDPLMDPVEVAEAFNELKAVGKVKYFGVSNFSPSQFDLIQSRLDFSLVTNQVEFSVLHTAPLFDGTFDQAIMKNFQPMIWSPLAGGKLFAPEDKQDAQTKRVVATLKEIAAEIGPSVTIDQIAYAFILKHPCKPVIVVGTNNMERLGLNVDAVQIQLSKPQWFKILESSQGCEVP